MRLRGGIFGLRIVPYENDYSDWSVGNGVLAKALQLQRAQD